MPTGPPCGPAEPDGPPCGARPSGERPRRVVLEPGGPLLVEGPVEVVMEDGTTVVSERFMVALCTCRRSRLLPWCDTSHRRRARPPGSAAGER